MSPRAGTTSATREPRVWDGKTGQLLSGQPLDQQRHQHELMAQLHQRARRAKRLGAEVLIGCETHMPDGRVRRTERSLTMKQLLTEHGADVAARNETVRARREGRIADAINATRRRRDAYLAIQRQAKTTTLHGTSSRANAATPPTAPQQRERGSNSRARTRSSGVRRDKASERPRRQARCAHCRETFEPARYAQTYCSRPECRRARHAKHGRDHRTRRRSAIPANLAELSWDAASGDPRAANFDTKTVGLLALDAALAVVARLEAAA
jgi:hypothetical protein